MEGHGAEVGVVRVPSPGDLLVARDRPRTWRVVERTTPTHVHARKPNGTPHRIPMNRVGDWDLVPVETEEVLECILELRAAAIRSRV